MVSAPISGFRASLPFWIAFGFVPVLVLAAVLGGWWVLLPPVMGWHFVSFLDRLTGRNTDNPDPETPEGDLVWYRAVTVLWAPVQFALLLWVIWYATQAAHLGSLERIGLFFGVGVVSGTVGINFSHELMHQKDRGERFLGDALLAMALNCHFRSEHLLVHHRYVGTPRDAVSARYNEGFHRYFARVLTAVPRSAFRAEKAMLARKGLPWHDLSNPFWRYWALEAAMLVLAFGFGGWAGLGLFLFQALVAIWQLELTNYVEHYGLTRKYLGEGRYEHVHPRHSWNADHRATNWLLINLQRHSDHHYKPDRRFPLLQTYDDSEAPQLPYGYPLMTMLAMIPPVWRRRMNPRVRAWRRQYYPEITDWQRYNRASNPMPKGAS